MIDVESLLIGISVLGALAIIGGLVFAESAFLVGLFLPGGDMLLLVAGIFAAQGSLPLAGVLAVIFIAAVAGDNVGYYIGRKTGPRVFKKREGVFFRQEYAERATEFYKRHGGKTVIMARFFAYVRTFAPLVAGVAKMPHGKFLFYNVLGALLWAVSLVMLGYWLGVELAEEIERYIFPVALLGIALIFSPTIVYFVKNKPARAALKSKIRLNFPTRKNK